MPRIFKGSESTLRLLISKTGDYQALTEIKIKLYTTDIENAIEIIDGIQVCKNIATITLAPRAFMGMEDGLINYIIDGATEDDVFHTERQSNYMLKSLSYINEDGVASQTMTIESNGEYRVTPNDGLYVDINVNVPDLNGSYDDGFNAGYNQGKTDGVNEQKSKLETINITENGTYTKEDGYNQIEVNVPDLNGSYDEGYAAGEQAGYNSGYTQGQADVAANAIDLVATESGTYYTKYSNNIVYPEVTGVFPNGENFYNYAYTDKIYDTGIAPNANSEIELWFKPDNDGGTWGCIISAGHLDNDKYSIRIRRVAYDAIYIANFGEGKGNDVQFNLNTDIFNHIKLSANGLYVNGVLYDGFEPGDFTPQDTFVIDGFNGPWANGETGYYGMVKITTGGVENVIIPTKDGFKNTTTNTILPQIKENIGSKYNYINNDPIILDNLIKSVDVVPKINPQKVGLRLGYSKFTEVPEWLDFNGITDMESMFRDCTNLRTIPLIDTSNVTTMSYMFGNCSNLQTIPLIDTSNVADMYYMFSTCVSLQAIPLIDTSNVRTMERMFYGCSKLQTIPLLNTSNVTTMSYMFGNCGNLQTIPLIDTSNVTNMNHMFYDFSGIKTIVSLPKFNCQKVTDMGSYFSYYADGMSALTDVGGWENLKCNWNDKYGLATCPNLTYESCINILNGLYDFTGNGETPSNSQGKLKVAQSFIDKVGDEISIGTNKGWQITV